MNGAEIIETWLLSASDRRYKDLAGMIDNAIAEASQKLKVKITILENLLDKVNNDVVKYSIEIAAARQQILELQADVAKRKEMYVKFNGTYFELAERFDKQECDLDDVKQQLLERDAVIEQMKSFVGTGAMMVLPSPSEALRLYTEQIKKEVQKKCAEVCDQYMSRQAPILGRQIRELKL
jgi:predicted  nucleic acid-binding Zn-ribbon protein